MVKFGVPSSDEDSEDEQEERLDESKHDSEGFADDETKRERESPMASEIDEPFQEANNAKLQLMNHVLFPQETERLEFDEDTESEGDSMAPFGLITTAFAPTQTSRAPLTTPATTAMAVEQPIEPMYELDPEPSAVLPRHYQYEPRGSDLVVLASSIHDRKRTCSFPFRVGWGPRGQFVHTIARTVVAVNKIQIRPPDPQTSPEEHRAQIIARLNAHFNTPPPSRDRSPLVGECVECGELESVCCEVCSNAYCEEHIPKFAIRKENDSGFLCSVECDEKSKFSHIHEVNEHLAALCNKYDNKSQFPHPPLGGLALSPDRSVWELVKRLWCREFGGSTGGYEDVYVRRSSLSRWLEDTMRSEMEQEIKKCKNDVDIILAFLVGHDISRACKHAFAAKNFRLATLLSQAGEGATLREDIKNQTDVWKKSGTWGLMSEPYKNIYLLLGGGAFEEGLRPWVQQFTQRLSWLQGFGLQLWFGESPQNASIDHALAQYREAVKRAEAPRPGPALQPRLRTVWQSQEDADELEEVRLGLLRYYCHSLRLASKQLLRDGDGKEQKSCLAALLRPEAWVRDSLDYSLAWHLHDVLQFTPAYSLDEFARLDDLYMNFIWQLEAMGEWQWAIYVALHSPARNNGWVPNEEVAREILMRNISVVPDAALKDVPMTQNLFETLFDHPGTELADANMGSEEQQQQDQLERLTGCNPSWLHEAQAIRARYERLPSAELSHLLACVTNKEEHHLPRAIKVALTQLAPLYRLTWVPDRKGLANPFLAELENRLAPYQDLLSDLAPQIALSFLNEPEAEVPASEPKLPNTQSFYKIAGERPIPLSHELLSEFNAHYEF